MMRAIRDNEVSAAAMGKDVNRRRLEIFVFGSILIGIGGGGDGEFRAYLRPPPASCPCTTPSSSG